MITTSLGKGGGIHEWSIGGPRTDVDDYHPDGNRVSVLPVPSVVMPGTWLRHAGSGFVMSDLVLSCRIPIRHLREFSLPSCLSLKSVKAVIIDSMLVVAQRLRMITTSLGKGGGNRGSSPESLQSELRDYRIGGGVRSCLQ